MSRKLTFYLATIFAFAAYLYMLAQIGSTFEGPGINRPGSTSSLSDVFSLFTSNMVHMPGLLLMQILVIVAAARICGTLAVRVGQPAVIGEVIAGILLGPSLLGAQWPAAAAVLFAPESLPGLNLLSQFGLLLFMFVIGMELDPALLRKRADSAVVISHVSIVLPFALGMTSALLLYNRFAPPHVPFLSFSLFMGIAMSITAFPVLARILHDRGLNATPAGALSLACAAADDVTAWSALAIVIAIVRAGDPVIGLATLLAAATYVAVMIGIVRPLLSRVGTAYADRERLTGPVVTGILLFVFASSFFTQVAGIHALFGAFLAGAVMPEKGPFRRLLTAKVHDVSVYILLPIFFAFTGLHTQLGLLNSPSHWGITALIVLIAVFGKFGGSALAGRFLGESWKNSLLIGALMNTRGLMELVVLNIGLELGVISPIIFTMMVLMALATTFMAGPIIDMIERLFPGKTDEGETEILIAYARPETGRSLLRVAAVLSERASILALHVTQDAQRSPHEIEAIRAQNDADMNQCARDLGVHCSILSLTAEDITGAILDAARQRRASMLLLGGSRALFSSGPMGGRNAELLEKAPCRTAILIDDLPEDLQNVSLICKDSSDPLVALLPTARGSRRKWFSFFQHPASGMKKPWRPLTELHPPERTMLCIMQPDVFFSRSWASYNILVVQEKAKVQGS